MSEKFDWHGKREDGSSVVVPSQAAIAVYTNVNGDIVIRQQDSDATEDRIIVLNPDHVQKIIIALQEEYLEIEAIKRLDREASDQESHQ